MARHLHYCPSCQRYSLAEQCPGCGKRAELSRPPKFSLQDKYAALRRELRREELRKKGRY